MFPWIVFPVWTRVSQRPPKWHARAQALLSLMHFYLIITTQVYLTVFLTFPSLPIIFQLCPFICTISAWKATGYASVWLSPSPPFVLKFPLCMFLNLHYSTLFLVTHTSFSFPKPLSLYTALNYYYMSLCPSISLSLPSSISLCLYSCLYSCLWLTFYHNFCCRSPWFG